RGGLSRRQGDRPGPSCGPGDEGHRRQGAAAAGEPAASRSSAALKRAVVAGGAATDTRVAHRSGDRVKVRCDRMVHGGLCIAALDDGSTVLVAGAIPGERVEAELRYRKGRTWFAD